MSKHKKIKARKMWAYYSALPTAKAPMRVTHDKAHARMNAHGFIWPDKIRPVFVIPGDAASFDAMVEQMGHALTRPGTSPRFWKFFKATDESTARTMLAAVGITRPKDDDYNARKYEEAQP